MFKLGLTKNNPLKVWDVKCFNHGLRRIAEFSAFPQKVMSHTRFGFAAEVMNHMRFGFAARCEAVVMPVVTSHFSPDYTLARA